MFVVDPVSSPGPPSGEAQKAAGKKDEIVHFAWHAGARISDLKRAQSPYHWTYIYIYIYILCIRIYYVLFLPGVEHTHPSRMRAWPGAGWVSGMSPCILWARSPLTNESLTKGWTKQQKFWMRPISLLSTYLLRLVGSKLREIPCGHESSISDY